MRKRIVTLTVLAAVLAISLFGLPLAVGVARYFTEDEHAVLERVADSTALSVSDELAEGLPVPPVTSPRKGVRVAVYGPGGTRLAGEGPVIADEVVRGAHSDDFVAGDVGGDSAIAVPVLSGARLTGVVRAAISDAEVRHRTAVTWLTMLFLALIAIAATWLVARRLAARLARPLEELSAAAERLGDGDFTVRAHREGIPEIDSVADTLDTTARRIGETLARERAFSSEASHQLRTPLTGLRLQLEAGLETPGTERAALEAGVVSADRLEQTIADLMELARHRPAASEPVEVDALLEEVRQSWESLLAASGRELRIVVDQPPRPVVPPAAVRQILTVLLDNAMTHGRGAVTVTARDASDVFALDVTDEGPGLDRDEDPFGRGGKGHGIGLALARTLAEAEGGRLRLTVPSPPTFTLLLPVAVS
ncbi:sensor histidine kinase [Amycolatopsis sp. CA-230715]|uniref:sensor histidine kinase n=1 Tax=Amycolatopsis sp. CA-230715 TaxID=2745196 RepID=UPI001C010E62|nr:HAMP domain-containing sensor histidine kinase [Amycolatopsis sp. CA-230715]QWF80051.1 hypothetical protein HUW46_03466 [Amycolatopsis sp. CA-230715]